MKLLGRKKIELGPVRWLALRDAIDRFQKPAPGAERDRLAYTINLALDVKVANRLNYPELARVFAASNRHLELMKNQDAQRTIRGRG